MQKRDSKYFWVHDREIVSNILDDCIIILEIVELVKIVQIETLQSL